MRLLRRIAGRNGWLAALLAAAMAFAPVEAEAAADVAATDHCVVAADHIDDADGDSEHHQHHAHSCGSCHVHVLTPAPIARLSSLSPAAPRVSHAGWAVVTAPVQGLYRPPRA